MRNSLFGLLVAFVLAFSACGGLNKDAEVNSFVAELDKLSAEIVRAVDAKPTAAGVEQAQQILDARKPELKAKFDQLKNLRGYELSQETAKKLTESVAKNVESVGSLQIKHAEKSVGDADFGERLTKLSTGFTSILGV